MRRLTQGNSIHPAHIVALWPLQIYVRGGTDYDPGTADLQDLGLRELMDRWGLYAAHNRPSAVFHAAIETYNSTAIACLGQPFAPPSGGTRWSYPNRTHRVL